MKKHRILMLGTLGQNNIGDELMGQQFLNLYQNLYPNSIFYLNSYKPKESQFEFSNDNCIFFDTKNRIHLAYLIFRSDLIVFAGGNIIKELYSEYGGYKNATLDKINWLTKFAAFFNKPIFYEQIGIGPLKSKESIDLAKKILSRATTITVRDKTSIDHIENNQLVKTYKFIPDIAFSMDINSKIRTINSVDDLEYIGINLCRNIENNNNWNLIITELAKAMVEIKVLNKNIKFIGIPMQSNFDGNNDVLALNELKSITDTDNIAFEILSPLNHQEVHTILDTTQIIIGARLHLLIMSTLKTVPFVPLEYDEKILGFMKNINLTKMLIPINKQFESKDITKSIIDITTNYSELQNRYDESKIKFKNMIIQHFTNNTTPDKEPKDQTNTSFFDNIYIQKLKEFFIKFKWEASLILISMITFWKWLSFDIFTKSDWGYYNPAQLKAFANYSVWNFANNLGSGDETLWRYPYYFTMGALANLGLPFEVVDKLTILWPLIFLTPLAGYYLIRSFKVSQFSSWIGALLFTFNTYFLSIITQGHILLNLAFVYGTFSFIFFKKGFEENNKNYHFLSIFFISLTAFLDLRSLYVCLFLLFFYSIFNLKIIIPQITRLFYFAAFLLLNNIFWLIPFVTTKTVFGADVLNRTLFGNAYFKLRYAVSLYYPFWTGGKIFWFELQKVNPFYYILPILALIGLITLFVVKKYKLAIFFLVLTFIGLILSKQIDNPFPDIYPWMFYNFPGFRGFREATKFYFIIVFCYSILIGIGLDWAFKLKESFLKVGLYSVIICTMLITSIWNILPYVSLNIGSMSVSRTMPSIYKEFNYVNVSNKDYYRTVWLPRKSRWIEQTNSKPQISFIELMNNELYHLNDLDQEDIVSTNIITTIETYFNSSYFKDFLNKLSVKYIAIPTEDKENDDNFYNFYGGDRNKFLDLLTNKDYLVKDDLSNSEFDLYRVKDFGSQFEARKTQLIGITDPKNFNQKYDFIKNGMGYNESTIINFADKKNTSKNTDGINIITDPFYNIKPENINTGNNRIKTNFNLSDYKSLYLYNSNYKIQSILEGNKLSFKLIGTSNDFQFINKDQVIDNIVLKELEIDTNQSYIVKYKNNYIRLNQGINNLGSYNDKTEIELFTEGTINLVPNGDFELGLWDSSVKDCSNYDTFPDISAERIENGYNNSRSLQLKSKKHIACTQKIIALEEDTNYFFKFKYLSSNKQEGFASYNLSFLDLYKNLQSNDPTINIKERTFSNKDEYQTYTKFFANPKNNTKVEISLYAQELESGNVVNYDDVEIFKITAKDKIFIPDLPGKYQKIPTNLLADQKVEIQSPFKINNLINNGDFELGLWQSKVSDCNTYDNDPKLDMKLGNQNNTKTLDLFAGNHIACSSQDLTFDFNSEQLLVNFDYFSDTNFIGYYMIFNDLNSTLIKKTINLKPNEIKNWKNYNKLINVPKGSTKVTIGLYGFPNGINKKLEKTSYDNIKVYNLPKVDSGIYLTSQEAQPKTEKEPINTKNVDETNQTLNISDNKYNVLAFNNLYDDEWKISNLDDNSHYKSVFATNIWKLNPNYDNSKLDLKFRTNDLFYAFLPLSSISIFSLIGIILVNLRKITKKQK
jgi:polysaccharide pyruvyl transferase WcaK-like protein